MRVNILFFLLWNFSCLGQELVDSISVEKLPPSQIGISLEEPEWRTNNYTQEDKIYNRSVWTFAENPALTGFDRKFAVAYRYRMRNLAMGVPNGKGNLVLGFMRHEAFVDHAFGGERKNWAIGGYYNYEKELQHSYHRIQITHSYRIKIEQHQLIFGMGMGVQFSNLDDWDKLTFNDMIDPRSGFVYTTQQPRPHSNRILPFMNCGLRYTWRRLFFDYALQRGPDGPFALAGAPTSVTTNRLHVGHHFKVDDEVTVTPEFAAVILTTGLWNPTNNYGLYSAYVTITYRDVVFGQIGMADQNRMTFQLGYQLRDMLVIQLGASNYFVRQMQEIGGLASVDIGIRAQINTRKK